MNIDETLLLFRSVSSSWGACCWPLTIVATRFGGLYEAGMFAAFPLPPVLVPREWEGSGSDDAWWYAVREHALPIGVGSTPDEALVHLRSILAAPPEARLALMNRSLEEMAAEADGLTFTRAAPPPPPTAG